MADISKDELRKEITAILKDADLKSTSSKKVRQELEEKLDCDLISRKKEIDDLVMEYVNSKDKKSKKKKKQEDSDDEPEEDEDEEEEEEEEEDESEEEQKKPVVKRGSGAASKKPAKKSKKNDSDESGSGGSDGESDEEYSPKKAKPPKARKLPPKKKKGSDSDSDEDWGKSAKKASPKKGGGGGGKRGGGGYTKAHTLSPELAELMGQDMMARHEVVKKIWGIIKERDLYDPKNKQFAICDDDLFKVMGVKRFRTFGMMKYLKTHFVD